MKNIKINLLVLLFISCPVTAQSSAKSKKNTIFKTSGKVIKNSILSIPSDFVFMGKEVSNDWKRTAYYTGGIIGLIALDKVTTKFYQENIETSIDYKLPNINLIGAGRGKEWFSGENAYLTYPIISIYLGSFLSNKEKGQYAAINALKAIQYSTLITQISLKTIFGRNRPNRPLSETATAPFTNNNWDFFNPRKEFLFASSEASSLPSLHTTVYFALAKIFQMEYNNYWIPYGLMSVAWLSNIKSHNHWVSDIVLGGIVGTIIGKSIVLSSRKKRDVNQPIKKEKNISFSVLPQYSQDFSGIKIVGNF